MKKPNHSSTQGLYIGGQRTQQRTGGKEGLGPNSRALTVCAGITGPKDHVDGCPMLLDAQSGVLQPRSEGCFKAHLAQLRRKA